jgi:hypothetical protein
MNINPNSINDNIINQVIVCKTSDRPFRIIKSELELYRKMNFPIPKKHPDIRHKERMSRRPHRKLFLRECNKTKTKIISIYPEKKTFPVYNETIF